jgi:hypothetical protein
MHVGPVIASYSYCSDVIDKRYRIYPLSLFVKLSFKSKYIKILFCFLQKQYTQKYSEKFLLMWGNENIRSSYN